MDIPEETKEKSPDLFVRRDPGDVKPFIAGNRSRRKSATRSSKVVGQNHADRDNELYIRRDERGRLARELHDSTAQLLVTLELQLMRLKQTACAADSKLFGEILNALGTTISELHDEVRSLGDPGHLRTGRLGSELGAMATEFAARTGLQVRTHFDELPDSVTPEIARTIYQIAQEALANASRHARPSNVSLNLAVANETVTLRTVDDGVGFRTPPGGSGAGRGLANMQSRLDQVGGKLTIQNLEQGAMIEATIPLIF